MSKCSESILRYILQYFDIEYVYFGAEYVFLDYKIKYIYCFVGTIKDVL